MGSEAKALAKEEIDRLRDGRHPVDWDRLWFTIDALTARAEKAEAEHRTD